MSAFPPPPEYMVPLGARSPLARFMWLVIIGWSSGCFALFVVRGGTSWHYFSLAQQAVLDLDDHVAGGLHVYSALPYLQFGPAAFAAAAATAPFGPRALLVAQVAGVLAGIVVLGVIRDVAARTRPDLSRRQIDLRTLFAGLCVIPVWSYLAVSAAHLDDVVTLVMAVLGLRAAVTRHAVLAGVLLALAVDAKPWAVPFVCLVLLLPRDRRRAALLTYAAVLAVAWLPFLLGDLGTLHALRYTIPNTDFSALRVLGVDSARTPPWDRPAQCVLGIAVSLVALGRRRWQLVLLAAIAARVVLDPGTNHYYIAGIAVGAAVWDITGSRRSFPWWTAGAFIDLFVVRYLPLPPVVNGITMLGFFAGVCVLAALRQPRSTTGTLPPASQFRGGSRHRATAMRSRRSTTAGRLARSSGVSAVRSAAASGSATASSRERR